MHFVPLKELQEKEKGREQPFSRVESMMSWQREFLAKEQEMMLEVQ